MAAGVHQAGRFAPRPGRQPDEGLAQLDAMASGGPVQPFYRAEQQVAIGGMRHRLGLNCRVHGDALQLALAHGFGLDGNRNGLGE